MKHKSNLPVPNIYYDNIFSRQAAKLVPGEYFVTGKDMLIVSVMGASVVACIRDTTKGIGGMTHFIVPSQHTALNGRLQKAALDVSRDAIVTLVKKLIAAGARYEDMEAKIFSGPCELNPLQAADLGFIQRNLKSAKIPHEVHTLTSMPTHKVYFFPKTGKVLVKKLAQLRNNTVAERQAAYIKSVASGKFLRAPV